MDTTVRPRSLLSPRSKVQRFRSLPPAQPAQKYALLTTVFGWLTRALTGFDAAAMSGIYVIRRELLQAMPRRSNTGVVNFEIVGYDSTDVRGVGETLPFVDNAFDAVVSIAVLEHVKDPFRSAAERAGSVRSILP